MKHNTKITLILITMFLITQLIGLFVISVYHSDANKLPYGMEPPEEIRDESPLFPIIIAFILAIALFFILTRLNAEKLIRFWFFVVTVIAIGLTLKAIGVLALPENIISFTNNFSVSYLSLAAVLIALPLAFFKIYKRDLLVHNITELLIYPGIAAVFVPILNVFGIIVLLFLISLYDIWAVWRSEFMQKMAKYQINNLKFFTGFFIPYASPEDKKKIKTIKQKYKNKPDKVIEDKFKKEKIKINLAILGGGDVIFPIIAAGVFLSIFNSILLALVISLTSTLALLSLFMLARKGKFYPAMPFLTIGIYIGMVIDWLILSIRIF